MSESCDIACSGHVAGAGDGNDMTMKWHCYPGNIAMLCIALQPSQPRDNWAKDS